MKYEPLIYTPTLHNKTILLLSTSKDLIASTPFWKLLFSSRCMSHKNPYSSSSPFGLTWSVIVLVFVSRENWSTFMRELWWLVWWRVGIIEEEEEESWLYPTGMVWLVGDDEAKVRELGDGYGVVSNMSVALFSDLLLWKTLHKTQSSCNHQQILT